MPITAGLYYTLFEGGRYEKPPVVLLHGTGLNGQCWPPAFRRLPGQRVYTVDLPGHGKSQGTGVQTVRQYSQAVLAWMAELGLYQAVFVGHSLGGAVALDIAVCHPDQAAGLGLISSGAYLGVAPELINHLGSASTLSLGLNYLQPRLCGAAIKPQQVESWMEPYRQVRSSVLLADFRACANFDLRAEVYRVTAPVWVACGTEDQLTPLAYSHFLAGQLPQAALQMVPGAGHFALFEQPDVLALGLRRFLAGITPPFIRLDKNGLVVEEYSDLEEWED